MQRFLITTANERSWKFDCPVLFLGEWCQRYDRKKVWSNMDAVVAEPYGVKDGEKDRDLVYIQSLFNILLKELVDALNTYHNTHHGLRYWHIVLGPWLRRYIGVAFNRYYTLKQALEKYDVSSSIVFDINSYSLTTKDFHSFNLAYDDDIWNHVFFSRILTYWGDINLELEQEPLRDVSDFSLNEKLKTASKTSFKHSIFNAAGFMLSKFSRNRDAFIINSYLPRMEEVKLQLSLGQIPQFWKSPKLKSVLSDRNQRQRLLIESTKHEGFDRFVRMVLHEVLPTCYLEGYRQLVDQSEALTWPSKPRYIFTSNNFGTDEIFKVWVAKKTEQNVPYFTGQHGNNYGTVLGSKDWTEVITCDKFFTWGWSNGKNKNIPAFIFKTAGQKPRYKISDGALLLIEFRQPSMRGPEDSYYRYGKYREEQFRFIDALPEEIQQKLIVRFPKANQNFNWSIDQCWKDHSPHTKLENGETPIRKLIDKSRLVVHSYDSTGILETLALNIPTMCFWYGGLEHLLPEAKPYYKLLINAGILVDTPEHAAKLITLHWNNLREWWVNQKTQEARIAFCEQFARTKNNPISTLKQLLVM